MSQPSARRRGGLALALLGAATVWMVLFWVIYLPAEWVCAEARPADDVVGGLDWLSLGVVAATVLALAVASAVTVVAAGRTVDAETRLVSLILGAIFVVSIVVIGLPALILQPC